MASTIPRLTVTMVGVSELAKAIEHWVGHLGTRQRWLEWPGDGPSIVCLHNMWATAETWADLPAALGGRYRVLSGDLPGHGESDPLDPDPPSPHLAAMFEQLGGAPAILAGSSAGGMRAGIAAMEHPEWVRRLVMLEPPLLATASSRDVERQRLSAVPEAPASFEALFAGYRKIFPNARPALLETYLRRTHRDVNGRWVARVRIAEPPQYASRLAYTPANLARLALPVLVLVAEHSKLCGPKGGEILGKAIPNCEVHVIRGAGHLALLNAPEEVYAAIAAFCAPELATEPDEARTRPQKSGAL